jgi:DNA-directed RNA polymerase specialized sigma24 family protein
MVWYAFGAAGDVDIADFKPAPENILSFHQEAERLEAALERTPEPQRPVLRMR